MARSWTRCDRSLRSCDKAPPVADPAGHYDTHSQLERHLTDFVSAYNFARRLKTLKGLTPYEFICKRQTIEPEKFRLNPIHQMPGLNI